MEEADLERFFSFVEKTDSCWLWTGCCNKQGYGRFRFAGKTYFAHRLIYIHCFGDPGKLEICHASGIKCKKNCVNPDHLREDTNSANQKDKILDGTILQGEKNHKSKLTSEQVLEIRSSPESQKELAKKYNVNSEAISKIKLRKTWSHL
jgi:hypothetical protein